MNTINESPHGSYRKTTVMVGILFIIGTVSGILAGVVLAPIQAGPTYPLNLSANETQWIVGTLLILLMGLSLAMTPVLLYPIFKKHNEVLAFGSVLFRGVLEQVGQILMAISFFLLLKRQRDPWKVWSSRCGHFSNTGFIAHRRRTLEPNDRGNRFQRRYDDDVRRILSNHAHPPVGVGLGSCWRSVVLHRLHCRHVQLRRIWLRTSARESGFCLSQLPSKKWSLRSG